MTSKRGAPRFEAALNRLREERLAVEETRRAIQRDIGLRMEDAAHHRQLLAQTYAELGQLARAIETLERMEAEGLYLPPAEGAQPRLSREVGAEAAGGSGLLDQPPVAPLGRLGALS